MNIERLPYLLARYGEGVLDSSEWEELKRLMDRDDLVQFIAEDLDKTYPLPVSAKWNKAGMEQAWRKINPAGTGVAPVHRVHFLKTSWFRYAAAVILVLGAVAYFRSADKKREPTLAGNSKHPQMDVAPMRDRAVLTLADGRQIVLDSAQGDIVKQEGLAVINLAGKLKYEGAGSNTEYNTIATPKGGQYQIVLPDGSRIWLNAVSSVRFPTAFTGSERTVEMTGEAYMEIAGNPKQPFVVKTGRAEIQVLGTSFNVNAYADESVLKTTLIDGSVKVTAAKAVLLKPGQQCMVTNNELSVINNADIEEAIAWKNGVFEVSHADLAQTMRQLARWYDIEVVYENGVPDIDLWGKIKKDLTLSQMLDVLSGWGVKFRMEGKRLIIKQ